MNAKHEKIDSDLDPSIYRYIIRHTKKDQIILLILTLISMPFVYLALDIPKIIVNQAIGGQGPYQLFGFDLEQIPYLLTLSGIFLLLVIINGGLKYVNNVYRGALGERMLRRIRYTLYSHVLRFPLPHFKKVSSNEIIPMVTSETEPLGGFIGDSIALPLFQGGLLLTYLSFIFAQDVFLGLAAIALYPPQMYLIPKLQKKVNDLAKERILNVRQLADHIGESVNGIADIHANNHGHYSRARASTRLESIFDIRYEIYRKKFFIKFLNNFLAQLTPFFFYSIGGYLVLTGDLSLGALVAVLAAYKDISPPWKELLKFYQIKEDIKVKYAQVIEQFTPQGLMNRELIEQRQDVSSGLGKELRVSSLSFGDPEEEESLKSVTFSMPTDKHIAMLADNAQQADYLIQLIARLQIPDSGKIMFDNQELQTLTESVTGKSIAYCDESSYVFKDTVFNNFTTGLKHQPGISQELAADSQPPAIDFEKFKSKAIASGNSDEHSDDNWMDYEMTGASNYQEFEEKLLEVMRIVELDSDIFVFGLRQHIESENYPDIVPKIVKARTLLKSTISSDVFERLVETFDPERYNSNLSVAENIVFGSPLDESYGEDQLASNQEVLEILKSTHLLEDLYTIGLNTASTMLDIFSTVDEDSDLFEQYSFIKASELEDYKGIVTQASEQSISSLSNDHQSMLLNLAMQLIPTQHRLGLITPDLEQRILEVRHALFEKIGQDNNKISFFAPDLYNNNVSVSDNILFGRIRFGQGNARETVNQGIRKVINELEIEKDIIKLGLEFNTGPSGSKLNSSQRQKLCLGRSILKNAELLLINRPLSSLDADSQQRILDNVRKIRANQNLLVRVNSEEEASAYDHLLNLSNSSISFQ